MGQIYQIHQARLINDLNQFAKKRTVNKNLINYFSDYGITKKDFYEYMDGIDKQEKRALHKILVDSYNFYHQHTADTDLQLRYDIEDVYYTITTIIPIIIFTMFCSPRPYFLFIFFSRNIQFIMCYCFCCYL